MGRPKIGVVGSNMVDLIAYAPRMPIIGETLEAPSFEMGFGGKGANQAVAAAKLGAAVVMVSKVGDDMFAEGTVKNLSSFGIDTTHVHRVTDRSSGVAPIVVDASGATALLIIKGANADLSPADVEEAAGALEGCDLILLQLEVPLETVYATIAFGKRRGIRTLLNPAPATTALDLARIIDVDYFVPNETELAILAGMAVGGEADIVAAARQSLADPDWFKKIREGKGEEIRRCFFTNYCEGLDQSHEVVTCQRWDRLKGLSDDQTVPRTRDGRRMFAP